MTIAYRLAEPSDVPFVIGGWLSAFRRSIDAGPIPAETYAEVYTDAIRRLVRRPSVDVLVAYFPGETVADLAGFLAHEKTSRGPVVHFCYTRKAQQRLGMARGLFAAAGIDPGKPFVYTYRTPIVEELHDRGKLPQATYNPLCARFDTAWKEQRES